jgi:calcineurin-like phosphoesterase family protein
MAVYFTSDPHFGHADVIHYCNRPFANTEEMDHEIISRWNEMVQPEDTIYCLGDWCFAKGFKSIGHAAKAYRQRINCQNIILIWGNHDKKGRKDKRFQEQFNGCYDLLEIKVGEQRIVLCHYAMRLWNKSHRGAYHLYGHSHGSLPDDPTSRSFDCGVDCNDFRPFSMDQVTLLMSRKRWKPIDYHDS